MAFIHLHMTFYIIYKIYFILLFNKLVIQLEYLVLSFNVKNTLEK